MYHIVCRWYYLGLQDMQASQAAAPHCLERFAAAGGHGDYASNVERDILRQLNKKKPAT